MQKLELKQKKKKKKEDFKSMGSFGIGKRNDREDHLIYFAGEHILVIGNTCTLFQKPPPPPLPALPLPKVLHFTSHHMGKQETR